jgi:Protein of unknown function (DUF1592)/Protein of unknown function (DUF1588)/Protein of unknown function (DUF1595)/Protein of unknown function (DUF1585)/Protein of unknown function (DUF1587)
MPNPHRVARVVAAGLAAAWLAACFGNSEQSLSGPISNEDPGRFPNQDSSDEAGNVPFEPVPLRLRKLLQWQYRNAVRDLLGPEAANVVTPPPDTAVNGYDAIGASLISVSSDAISKYEVSALKAAQLALADPAHRAALVPCQPSAPEDSGCLAQVVRAFGLRAWRRPLSEEEISEWVAVGQEAALAYNAFDRGVEFAVAGLLQSPNFLYQIEVGEPEPDAPDRLRLTGYELATRMSFFLVGTVPDAELLAAVEKGELAAPDQIRAQARRLLAKPEAKASIQQFFDEALQLRDFSSLSKDPGLFPEFTPALAQAMRQESAYLIEDIVWTRDGDLRDLFDAPYTFVNADLAALYGLPDAPTSGFGRVELPASSKRAGFFGQASFLSLKAHSNETAPTLRGKFIREALLCQMIGAPPPEVDTSIPESPTDQPQTMRQRLSAHANGACSGCHVLMDPLGLGLENFDAIGRYREKEHGLDIDPHSSFDDKGTFDGPRTLGALLRQDERVTECLVRNVFRAATGHVETEGETSSIDKVHQAFASSGYRMKNLLVEIVASDAFRFAAKEEVQP